MPYRSLATINHNRSLTHDAGQIVYLNWDDHSFSFTRAGFSRFARALQRGAVRLYAGQRDYCVVAVDSDLRDVWIEDTCLTLDWRDYRSLLNATLTTETRLHGFRAPRQPQDEAAEPTICYCAPAPLRFYWN